MLRIVPQDPEGAPSWPLGSERFRNGRAALIACSPNMRAKYSRCALRIYSPATRKPLSMPDLLPLPPPMNNEQLDALVAAASPEDLRRALRIVLGAEQA